LYSLAQGIMAKNQKPKRNDLVVKVDAECVRKARIIAAYEGVTMAELLTGILSPILDKQLERHQKQPNRAKGGD